MPPQQAFNSNLIMQNYFSFFSLSLTHTRRLVGLLLLSFVREWPTKYFYYTIEGKWKKLHRRVITKYFLLSAAPRNSRNRIDYQQWQILSLMPLVVSFLLSKKKFIGGLLLFKLIIAAVILDSIRSSDSLCTFSACKVSSTSGSNYFSCELRFLAAAFEFLSSCNSVFQSTIA